MDINQIKRNIHTKLRDLRKLQDAAQAACAPVTLDQTRVGRLSRMDAMQSQAMNQEAQRRRGIEIQRLEAALHHLGRGDYGYCVECDEQISEGRLLLDPAVKYCIRCAQQFEQKP